MVCYIRFLSVRGYCTNVLLSLKNQFPIKAKAKPYTTAFSSVSLLSWPPFIINTHITYKYIVNPLKYFIITAL